MKKLFYLAAAVMFVCAAMSCKQDPVPTEDDDSQWTEGFVFQAVDMGFTYGGKTIKFANANLGAKHPGDYGDYYAWGEITPKTKFTTANYTYKDNPAVLPPAADAANAKLGGHWRMPTGEELDAFNDWIAASGSPYSIEMKTAYGKVGFEIKHKSTGNSIFLPCGGDINGTTQSGFDSFFEVWSSSLTPDIHEMQEEQKNQRAEAWGIDKPMDLYQLGTAGCARYIGLPIRPVWVE
ncbi:MAG: hypothetical protein IKX37_05520 [Bacteroidales bacterium]|nr:hypothetical protein [Bacteroidales bacterium]